MINVKFVKEGPLVYSIEYDHEGEKSMERLLDGLETTMPIIPKVGDKLDLSTFLDLESLSDDDRDLLEDEWCAVVCNIYVERHRLRIHILNSGLYENIKHQYEN